MIRRSRRKNVEKNSNKHSSPSSKREPKRKNVEKNSKKRSSPSSKWESKIPKVEDILRKRQECIQFSNVCTSLRESATRFLHEIEENKQKISNNNNDDDEDLEKPKQETLNCKHLTLKQLKRRFEKDAAYLDDIFKGRTYSKRHELFFETEQLDNTENCDLRVNDCTNAFTEEQNIYLVTLFRQRYDNGNRYKYCDYYFKVLLPEYCLKIFMAVHKMGCDEALDYLKAVSFRDIHID